MVGDSERACGEDGRWSGAPPSCSEIRCQLPPRPNNTIVSVSSTERLHGTSVLRSKLSSKVAYRVGSTLKYRCERGYILDVGGKASSSLSSSSSSPEAPLRVVTRRCTTKGSWTGSTPSCVYVDCEQPEEPENAIVKLASTGATYYGSMAFYKCEDHFNLDGKN